MLGTINDINAALATLSYLGDQDFNGSDQINVAVTEVSNPGPGGPPTDTVAIPVTANAVADIPVLIAAGGAIETPDDSAIATEVDLWLTRPERLSNMREACKKFVTTQDNSLTKTLETLESALNLR